MIDIQDVHKQFTAQSGGSLFKRGVKRTVHAVQGVTVRAGDGRITGLLGANGAGKTTTLRMLAGLFPPDSGHISVDGIAVKDAPLKAIARMGILGDAHGLYPRLSARENIIYLRDELTQEMVEDAIEAI